MSTAPRAKPQGPSREFKQRRRAYIVKMREDVKLPAPAKLVCWAVTEHWNEETDQAKVSTVTIAREAGISQTNVRNMLRHPRMPEHMRVEFGSKGSRHSNRYWPIEQTGAQTKVPIEQFSPPIEHPSAMNLTNQSAASAARSEFEDRGAVTTNTEPVPESAPDGALDAVKRIYPKYLPDPYDGRCGEMMLRVLDSGVTMETVTTAARRYAQRGDTLETVEPLYDFLLAFLTL